MVLSHSRVVASALTLTTESEVVARSYVLLAGLPLAIMAMALAILHAQHGLVERIYRILALAWAVAALVVLAPFPVVKHLPGASAVLWTRVVASALAAARFAGLVVHAWKRRGRVSLAIGFDGVALFFGFRAGRYLVPSDPGGLESVTEALADFFVNAVITCALLLPGLIAVSIARRRGEQVPPR
jgi:hypothetical protein